MVGRSPAMQTVFDAAERRRPATRPSCSKARPAPARRSPPSRSTATARAATSRSSSSTAARCRRSCSRASCSGTSAARSPARCARQGAFEAAAAARCSSTRLASCASTCSRSCCACSSAARCGASAPTTTSRSTCVVAATNRNLRDEVTARGSAPICTTGWRSSRCSCRRCASGRRPPALVEHILRNLGTVDDDAQATVRSPGFLGELAAHAGRATCASCATTWSAAVALPDFALPRASEPGRADPGVRAPWTSASR